MKKSRKIAAAVVAAAMCLSSTGFSYMADYSIADHSITASAATTIWDGSIDTSWYDGEETEMHISTAEEFAGFVKLVSGGNKMDNQKIILDKDIYLNDLSEMKTDNAVPSNLWSIKGGVFSGVFEGGKHTVYGLYTPKKNSLCSVSEGASISNLSFENAIIGAPVFLSNAGCISGVHVSATATGQSVLCYENKGTITECSTDGTLSSQASTIGGLCVINYSAIEKCTNNAAVNASCSAGGIVYWNDGQISGCTNNGTINTQYTDFNNYSYIGGIFATTSTYKDDIICENCVNNADLIYEGDNKYGGYSGGICGNGKFVKLFHSCINNGNIQITYSANVKPSEGWYVGGMAGRGTAFEQCGNNGTISVAGYAGGITGKEDGNVVVKYCYNKGDVSGNTVGGLIGVNSRYSYDITNSYNTGSISSDNYYAGGLVGNGSGTITSCYSAASSVTGKYAGSLLGCGNIWSESSECYYLNSGASQAIGKTAGEFGTPKSAANMKKEAFAASLGNAFVYNPNGFPMLFWEAGIPMLSLDKTTLNFNEYMQQETITPDTSYEGELKWTSSDDTIATVDQNGIVIAIGNGTCTITAEAGGAKALCEVTVAYNYYFKENEITMKPDLAKELKVYSKSNDEPTTLEVKYSSSNEDVAEVNKRGVVSANAPGVAEIHAEIGSMDLVCVVTVEGVKGDVNVDGEFNVSDVVLLQKWLLAVPDTHLANWKAADLCEDNRLDVFDLCLMKRELVDKKA